MRRRRLLAALAAAPLAGCTGSGSTPGTEPETDTATSTPTPAAEPPLVDARLTAAGECPDPGGARVSFRPADGEVVVEGCVVGRDGCRVAALDCAKYADGAFRVVVATVDDSESGEFCTEALTDLGYRVGADFEGGVPARVTVVHDDVEGRRTVVTAER